MKPLLETIDVCKYFGDLAAVNKLSLEVAPGEILGIAGPNGAGKTTLFSVITGIPYPVSSGKIIFDGKEIQGLKPHLIVQMGIARTFQIPRVFKTLTVYENVAVGALFGKSTGIFTRSLIDERAQTTEALDLVGLLGKKDMIAQSLTLLDLKRLMIASALATRPRLLMLDEPMAGLTESEMNETIELIRKVKQEKGMTVMIIEHIMTALVSLCDRMMILSEGQKISEGTPEQVTRDGKVIEVYLGEKVAEST
jgi:branched-chain amino acid transport system ATP-binding protein